MASLAGSWRAKQEAKVHCRAALIAYLDDFYLMMWVTLAAIPLVLLLRPQKKDEPGELHDAVAID